MRPIFTSCLCILSYTITGSLMQSDLGSERDCRITQFCDLPDFVISRFPREYACRIPGDRLKQAFSTVTTVAEQPRVQERRLPPLVGVLSFALTHSGPIGPPSQTDALEHQPRRATSIDAMSIFPICIIASKARLAAARSGSAIAAVSARGVICHDRPHLSLHHPQALS